MMTCEATQHKPGVFSDVKTPTLIKAERLVTAILCTICFSKAAASEELAQFERLYKQALGRVLRSHLPHARILNIDRSTLYRRLHRFKISTTE